MPNRQARSQARALRALGALSFVVPVVVAACFGAYRFGEARSQSLAQVERALRVAHENASKVLGTSEGAEDRVVDLVRGRSVAELRADEARLHEALAARAKGQPQIQAIWIIGSDGAPIASSRSFPAFDVSSLDREYFRRHQAGPAGRRFISEPMASRGSSAKVVDLSVGFEGPAGELGGVVDVSLRTDYFKDFYSDLAASDPGLAVALVGADGSLYARFPPTAIEKLPSDSPMMAAMSSGDSAGGMLAKSAVDGHDRLTSFRKVDDYPLYVVAGMSISALRMAMFKDLGVLLAFGFPPFLALWLTARTAARRAEEAAEQGERLAEEMATRKRVEEALSRSQRLEALGRVAGGVAHEFNNVLMVIGGNAQILRRGSDAGEAKRLDSIGRSIEKGAKLTRQLLSFTKRQALAPEAVDLAPFLGGIEDILKATLGSGIALSIEVDPGLPPIFADPAELELAMVNLAINAREAMPEGGTLRARARAASHAPSIDGEAIAIEVSDSGRGVDPELVDKVFEPFFTTKEVGAGAGLGLSQVHAMCQRVGGDARIFSRPGAGATVTMLLRAAPPVAPAPEAATSIGGLRILLVEDDDEVADATLGLLSELGCAADRVEGAAQALDWLESRGGSLPEVVVSDVRMPGSLDGLGLARRLRAERPGLPLLLVTGYAEGMGEIESAGFAVLAKPCSAEALRAAIAKATAGAEGA